MQKNVHRFVSIWLHAILIMTLAMILIGGVTRLTDSGLSMVDWKPLLGVIPPLTDTDWIEVFNQYKEFPQYQIVNQRMTLDEFKFIYFWEYFHRIFGRLIGLVFIIPFFYLLITRSIDKKWTLRFLLALILGGSQGLLGWYMVKSGLVDKPSVSHYRLAAHFSLALIILSYVYWLILKLKNQKSLIDPVINLMNPKVLYLFSTLLAVQIIFGAFVAGLKAGKFFNTYPKMGKHWIPPSIFSENLAFLVDSNVGVQFIHRLIAILLLLFAFYFLFLYFKSVQYKVMNLLILSITVIAQFTLGVITLLLNVPLLSACLHQILAAFLVLLTIRVLYIKIIDKSIAEFGQGLGFRQKSTLMQ